MTEKILIKTPQLGESITEGTILSINKKLGDFIENGKVLFELETEKVTVEVVTTASGIIENIFVKVGQVVKVDSHLALIIASEKPANSIEIPKEKILTDVPLKVELQQMPSASPAAYKIATEKNIDLSTIKASGSKGHILKEDVLFADSGIVADEKDEVIEFSDIRKSAIKNSQNNQYSAIYSIAVEKINIDKMALLSENEYLGIFIKAIAICVEQYPTLNALVFDDKILFKKDINIAIENKGELKIIANVLNKSIKQIMEDNAPADSTIYVCYMPKALLVTPAILGNQALGISICRNEIYEQKNFVNICIRFDNRVVNNIMAIEFLEELKNVIENPHLMLMV